MDWWIDWWIGWLYVTQNSSSFCSICCCWTFTLRLWCWHFTHFGIGCFGSQTDIDHSCQTIPKNVLSYYGNRTPSYKTWWKFNVLVCFICWLTKPVSAESAVLKFFVGIREWIDILTHEIIYFVWNRESFGKRKICILPLSVYNWPDFVTWGHPGL